MTTDTNPRAQTVGGRELERAGFAVVKELRPRNPETTTWQHGQWHQVELDGERYAALWLRRGNWHVFASSRPTWQSTGADLRPSDPLVLSAPKALVDKYAGLHAAQGQSTAERNPGPPPTHPSTRERVDGEMLEQLQDAHDQLARRVAQLETQQNPKPAPRQRAQQRNHAEERWVRLVDLDDGVELWRGPEDEFVAANRETAEIDAELAHVLEVLPRMEIGSHTNFGGGAAPWMMVQRVEPHSEMMPPGEPIGIENPREAEGASAQEEYLMAPGRPGTRSASRRSRKR